jgi:hypothetical protein
MLDRRAYIRKETAISVVINIAIATAFFLALFHGQPRVALWGAGGIVFDCLPQGFMVGLMSVLPPSLITMSRIRKGNIALQARPADGSLALASHALPVRALLMAVLGMIGLVGIAALMSSLSGASSVSFALGLTLKSLAAAVEAAIITPIAIRAVFDRAAP